MSEDLTKKLLQTTDEKLTLVLTLVQSLTARDNHIDLRLNNIDSRLATIDSRLVHVEQTVNDTQPVLQKLSTDVGQLQEGQRKLEDGQRQLQEGQSKLEDGQRELQTSVLQVQDGQRLLHQGQAILVSELQTLSRDVSQRFLVLSGAANAEILNLKERVTRVEQNLNPPNTQT